VKGESIDGLAILPKTIDNSQVVRERDPRTSRQVGLLLAVVAALVLGLVLYAWPNLELRQAGVEREQLARERERLLEENRKLRLEKAALTDLRRVEGIATRQLGLVAPPAAAVVVVEPRPPAPAGQVAERGRAPEEPR
jgi:cell division protein FtsL